MKKEPIPVKVNILRTIHRALLPIKSRLDAILKDYYAEKILISQAEFTALLEFRSAAATAEPAAEIRHVDKGPGHSDRGRHGRLRPST